MKITLYTTKDFQLATVHNIIGGNTPPRLPRTAQSALPEPVHCHWESDRQALYGGLYDSD